MTKTSATVAKTATDPEVTETETTVEKTAADKTDKTARTADNAARKSNQVPSNPLKISWPQDTYGFCTALRREGCRAAGRISGDKKKLAVLLETLKTIAGHAQARCAAQQEAITEARARAEALQAREQADEARRRREEVKRLKARIAHIEQPDDNA